MSAFIVSSAHIDVLVLASVQFGLIRQPDRDILTKLGADLWAENHRSVNYCYDDDEQPPPYTAPASEVILDAVAVVSAVDCYVYQTCEHPQWQASAAAEHCARLRLAAMHGLDVDGTMSGEGKTYPVGWMEAPWGITDIAQAGAGESTSQRGGR